MGAFIGVILFFGALILLIVFALKIENKEQEEENKEKERLRSQLKDDISELTNEQEKILDRWKRSAYCTRPNDKAEPKNETETCDEDADKKTD